MSVRKVHSNGKTIVGYINSSKSPHVIQFESYLEKQFLFLLQYDSNVVSIGDQPVKIKYSKKGNDHFYTPDFRVRYKNGTKVLFEVKYQSDLEKNSRKYAASFNAGRKHAASEGSLFRIITDKEIKSQYKKNVDFLITFRNSSADIDLQNKILSVIREKSVTNFMEVMTAITDNPSEQRALIRPFWVLLWKHVITTNLFEPLTLKSKVWVTDEKHPPVQLSFPYNRLPKIKQPKA